VSASSRIRSHAADCTSTGRPGRLARLRRSDDGANLVEAALALPIILLVIFGILELAGIVYAQMALQNGVSQATRFAITRAPLAGMNREQSIKAVLRRETPTLTIEDEGIELSHLAPGDAQWTAGVGPPEAIERVAVTYRWEVMTPIMSSFFPYGGIELRVASAMKSETDPPQ
jgi:Flp pilus assembly protein TadG